jgi:hypothetical protein
MNRYESHRVTCPECRVHPYAPCAEGSAIIAAMLARADPGSAGARVVLALKLSQAIDGREAERQLAESGRILDGACALAERSGIDSTVFMAQLAKTLGAGLGHYHQELASLEDQAVDPEVMVGDLVRWFHAIAAEAFAHLHCQGGEVADRLTRH